MLSPNDFKEKKILFVATRSGANLPDKLKIKNSNICLYQEGKLVNKVSCYLVFCVFIIGPIALTSELIKACKEYGISLFLLNYSLLPYAEVVALAEGNYKLRKKQYTLSTKKTLEISKGFVRNKIKNQYQLAKNYNDKINFTNYIKEIDGVKSLESLRGIEGIVAKEYFSEIFEPIGWYRRAPRTKEDIPNLQLDIGYTYLFNYVDAILRIFGFDTYKGVFHRLFFQRKSLTCDLIEPIRPVVDRQLVKSYNLGQIKEKDFKFIKGKFVFKPGRQKEYLNIWFKLLMNYRQEIFSYVLSYYRYFLVPEKYQFPIFKMKRL